MGSFVMRFIPAVIIAAIIATPAFAQQKEIKIGVIYDYTGPFADGGSAAAAIGTKSAIDQIGRAHV